ncbi:class I SAM-dependent methyltransferase [Mycobacterium sp.]|uniref:class I SAM-dependent methyltransferase n=1 Tax=Mycobacterium sp. TaxID=1785 RepID=UPI00126BB5EA|nr:class I SAM-dependent methyltransferase [Mycobacterium sp.]KAA8969990.1 MAG: class I SAM-dependent methyltransferase [Mycobacterium sp.]
MTSRHTLFRVFYRLGFTPWDGHPQSATLRDLVEGTDGTPALPPASALDVGCGTGDASIYLAQHGWRVTGVDFVGKALDRARAKARAAGVSVDFVCGDVTHLSRAGIGSGFHLVVDNGCFHGMSERDRDRYVREITAACATGARLFMVAFKPSGRFGPAGVDQSEIERRFTPAWTILSAADEPRAENRFAARFAGRSYVLQRHP